MDAFSEILSGVKLNGAVFFNAAFSAPWGLSAPPAQKLAPGAPHLLIYHLVVEGRAFARAADGRTLTLSPGDVVIFPHGDPHALSSEEHTLGPDQSRLIIEKVEQGDLSPLNVGGGGQTTRFVCGYMACDPHLGKPVLSGLPPVFTVNIRTDRSGHWLESTILHLVDEAASGHVGSAAMLAKLSEALFVDILRRYVAKLPDTETGWLAGARDAVIGKALGLLHGRPREAWTVASLADEVGLSRSALIERFSRYLAEPPMAYLTRWRLQLAARTLANTSRAVAAIAAEVGYESEASFNRAFKRQFGVPPARYRREQREAS